MKSPIQWNRIAIAGMLGLATSASHAHTGHGTSGLFQGLAHPFGLDHLLAMVAVGVWSVSALPSNKAWRGPAVFMFSLGISALMGSVWGAIPFLDNIISLSIVLFGAMLVLARFKIDPKVGLALISVAAAMHGWVHGAESPATGFAAYACGFLITTAALHAGGVSIGLGIKRFAPVVASTLTTTLGVLFGGAGVYLFTQI